MKTYEEMYPFKPFIPDTKTWKVSKGFDRQGSYAWSNACGYYVEISEDCDHARLQANFGDVWYMTDWLLIDDVLDAEYNQDCEYEYDNLRAVIDPDGFNVPLDLVMCT